jgi:hypothetical protein
LEENSTIRRFENAHIALWLVKDTCWMMGIHLLGTIMVVPTVFMAVFITIKTKKTPEFLLNLAVLCWITANSYWMVIEFFFHDAGKIWALLPFSAGLLFVAAYYFLILRQKHA